MVAGGFLFFMVMGSYYTWASVNIYACSYLMAHGDTTASIENLFLVLPLTEIVLTLAMPWGAHAALKYSPRLMVFLGTLVIFVGYFAASFMRHSVPFVFFFAVCFGLGNGLSYMAGLQSAWRYYPRRKGCAGGVVLSAIGVGAFLFSQLSSFLINPANRQPTLEVKLGKFSSFYYKGEIVKTFPSALRTLAYTQLGLGLAASLLVRAPSQRYLRSIDD